MHDWNFCRLGGALGIALAISACGGGGAPAVDQATATQADRETAGDASGEGERSTFVIRTLSNRADLISDGDALVEVQVPHNVRLDRVKMVLNGADISGAFVPTATPHTLRGVVKGLKVGRNELAVQS